jgi:putative sigma-54 modulation protein
MQVAITFRHMEASDALRNHIDAKLAHIQKYLLKPLEVHVTLSVEKFRHTAEFSLLEQHFQAKAKETTDDMYASVDLALAKIEIQVKKHKEKIQEHQKHHLSTQEASLQAENEYLRHEATAAME